MSSRSSSNSPAAPASAMEVVANGADGSTQPKLREFPGYETLGVLGVGGMGVVYRARQYAVNRLVAIKTLRNHEDASPKELARFRYEAEIVAQLVHPNVVPLYHVGEVNGQPFLAFELVEGGSLAKRIAGQPQPARQAGELVQTLARAVHAAHVRGIVHRDLTPHNILLAADGTPKIADFGLARAPDRVGQSAEQIVGTASYMAPEQAWGDVPARGFGPPTDVYGLGAILYELLTGLPPFKASTSQKTLLMVYHDPPRSPRSIAPSVPRDLETICLRCLEKDPARRFSSADELADDLRRYLAGEPITSRPVNRCERAWLWSKRNPLVALLAAALVTAVALGLGGTAFKAIEASKRADDYLQETRTSRRLAADATASRDAAVAAQRREAAVNRELQSQLYEYWILATERQVAEGAMLLLPGRRTESLAQLDRCPPELRNMEWHWLRRQLEGSQVTRQIAQFNLAAATVSRDGLRVAAVGRYTSAELPVPVQIWNTADWRVENSIANGAHALRFSPDRNLLALQWDDSVGLWDPVGGKPLARTPGQGDLLAFRSDGAVIAVGQSGFGLGLGANGKFTAERKPCSILLCQSRDFQPASVGLTMAKQVGVLKGADALPRDGCFTQGDSRLVVVSGWSNQLVDEGHPSYLQVWDVAAMKIAASVTAPSGETWHRVALAPDDRRCAVAAGNSARVFELTDCREVAKAVGLDRTTALAYSPDGRWLLVGDEMGRVLVFDALTLELKRLLGGHRNEVLTIGCDANQQAITVDAGGFAKVWDLRWPPALPGASPLAIRGDSRLLAAADPSGNGLRLWELPSRNEVARLQPAAANDRPAAVIEIAFSPNESELLSLWDDRFVRRFDLAANREIDSMSLGKPPEAQPRSRISLSDLQRQLASPRSADKRLADSQPAPDPPGSDGLRTPDLSAHVFQSAEFSPDGRFLLLARRWNDVDSRSLPWNGAAGWRGGYTIELWDLVLQKRVAEMAQVESPANPIRLTFDADSRLAYAACLGLLRDATVLGWETATGKRLSGKLVFPAPIESVISPDGERELRNEDASLRLFNRRNGRRLATIWNQSLEDAQFAPNGRFIVGAREGLQIIDVTPLP